MKKFIAMMAVVAMFSLAACGGVPGVGGGDDGGGGGGDFDMAQSMIDNTKEISYICMVHADPVAGQYWETFSEAYGNKTTTRWQITSIDGSTAIVENHTSVEGSMSYEYVYAYEVNLDADVAAGEVNVTKGWIGKPGEAGKELTVMAKPEATGCAGCAPEVETEPFSMEMAGTNFEGTLTIMDAGKMWMADNGWFNKMIKTEFGEMITELTAMGEDAEAVLLWE
ncbi:MAG: hypothetical protein L3J82_01975 [Planctomycetes bacterium]|nr:hypothetical protein [Planctomycetota bacterium]